MATCRLASLAIPLAAVLVGACATRSDSPSPAASSQGSRPPDAVTLENPPVIEYGRYPRLLPVPQPTAELAATFDGKRQGELVSVLKADGQEFSGYVTDNQAFLDEVLRPALAPHVEQLRRLDQVDQINALALFGHETYRVWFGRDAFAWGGHLHDLDDPQESGPNFEHRYGFDCSGFAALPYELAVEMGLMTPDDPAAVVTAAGYQRAAAANPDLRDTGGRGGTTNNWRVDTGDMEQVGRVITVIPKGGTASPGQLAILQPGDLVLAPGHVGLVVELGGGLYYLEHGGWVCPPNGGLPFEIEPALAIFAGVGELTIKRVLPDRR